MPHTSSGSLLMRHAPSAKMRIKERVRAEAIAKAAAGHRGPLGVSIEEKRQAPPRLFDLPALQKTCGQRWGWTADKTLSVAQELYDGVTSHSGGSRRGMGSAVPPATRVGSVPGARSAVTRAVAGREIGAIDSLSSVDSDNETLPSPGRTAVRSVEAKRGSDEEIHGVVYGLWG